MDLKALAKKGAKLWVAKKGLRATGGLLKVGAVAGAGYYAYKLYQKNSDTIKEKLNINRKRETTPEPHVS